MFANLLIHDNIHFAVSILYDVLGIRGLYSQSQMRGMLREVDLLPFRRALELSGLQWKILYTSRTLPNGWRAPRGVKVHTETRLNGCIVGAD